MHPSHMALFFTRKCADKYVKIKMCIVALKEKGHINKNDELVSNVS